MKVVEDFVLKNSPFVAEIEGVKFFFSTYKKMKKFLTEYEHEITQFNERLNRHYKKIYDIEFDDLALIRFYKYVERDDFYIEIDGVGVNCLERIKFQSVRVVS
jgi:hypothetical protein